jgi:cytoskeletal protein RodZ
VNAGLLVAIIVIAVIVLALAWLLMRQQRTARLRKQFGPEYERAVSESGSRQAAEAELEDRRARHEKFEIVALDPAARDRYLEQWRLVQAQFVDSPTEATRAADRLINEVMRECGYPVEEFEQRAADISVDHPQVVDDYRAAHTVAEANERSEASTEDLRQALVHYRSLFEDLLETHGAAAIGLHEASAGRDDAAAAGEHAVREHEAVRHEGGTTDERPSAASTPPERRTT